ncbi:lethal hybrid rescue [Haematobia irritans]|uniref:lethal hybrid rescue n=1 Tax=Haematobia irritans TaxID=7368 RepID=UPI003F4FA8B3
MVGAEGRGIQVLNISNVNALGKTVLNDCKLLELIQQYPFLYNPRVRPYGDSDYSMWAWKRINAAFNRSYENDPFAAFSISDLMERWQTLKPLIQCLSKAYDLNAIPASLRKSVLQISIELEDSSTNCLQKVNTQTQNLLLERMQDIGQLPLEKRLILESDILNLILKAEIDFKQSYTMEQSDITQANQEADEFLNDIGFNQVLEMAWKQQPKILPIKTENGSVTNGIQGKKRSRGKWIPLSEVDKHIRHCYVSIKRMNIEDIPLSVVKKAISLKTEVH